MAFGAALGAGLGSHCSIFDARNFNRNNPGWHGNNGIAQYHYYGSQRLTGACFRRNIAIAHRGQCNDRPVNASGNAGKAIFFALDDVHERAQNDDQG